MTIRWPSVWPTVQRMNTFYCFHASPPSANWRTKTPKTCVFLGGFDPFRHFSCLAEGVLAGIICYTGHVFWPSANELPWRERHAAPHYFTSSLIPRNQSRHGEDRLALVPAPLRQ